MACVYFSAKNISTNIDGAMLWTVLHQHAQLLDPKILTIAFVFLLVGYGTKIGLVPLHFWLPDAHSESPPPDVRASFWFVVKYRRLCINSF